MLLESYIRELLLEAPQTKLSDLTKYPGKFLLGKDYKSYWELSNEEFKSFYPNEDLSKRGPFFNCIKLCFDEFLSNENDPEFDVLEYIREMIIYINGLYDFKNNENVAPVYNKFIADGYNGFEELKQTYESLYEHIGSKNLNMFNNPSYINLIKTAQTQYLFDTPDRTMNGLLCVIPTTQQSSVFWARTNADAQGIVLNKTNAAQSSDPDFMKWCTGRIDESNMFNSYYIRGGTSLFYFLPVNDVEGINKFCVGITKIKNPNARSDKDFFLSCGGHTTVNFENAAFIPDGSDFKDDKTKQLMLDKFGQFGLTEEMLDIIVEKVSGRNPFDKYAYIGGLKPAEFAATVNMNTIGQTPEGRTSIKNQIEAILDTYKDPEFLKQYAPNPKILTIIDKDLRYFTMCRVSLKHLNQKYVSDINFWDSFVESEITDLENNNIRFSKIKSAQEIAEALLSTGSFNVNLYIDIIEKIKNSVIDRGLENKISGEFLNDCTRSVPLSIKAKMNVSDLRNLFNLQLDIFKSLPLMPISIQEFFFNQQELKFNSKKGHFVNTKHLSLLTNMLRKLFNNFEEFLNTMKIVCQDENLNFLSLHLDDLVPTNASSFAIPNEWMLDESFKEYIATLFNSSKYVKSRFINDFFNALNFYYKADFGKFYEKNVNFSNYTLIVIMQEIYFDEVLSIDSKRYDVNYNQMLTNNNNFKNLLMIYSGFKGYLSENEMFEDFSKELSGFLDTKNISFKTFDDAIFKAHQALLQSENIQDPQRSYNIKSSALQEFERNLNNFFQKGDGSKDTIANISKIFADLKVYQKFELYLAVQNFFFYPINSSQNPSIWIYLLTEIFENPVDTDLMWAEENGNIYSPVDIIENRKNKIYNLSNFDLTIDKLLDYEEIIIGMIRKFGYDSEQRVINLFYNIFPSYEKMPDSARDIFDQLLDYDSVTYNPWTGEGEINEVKRKYILGNKILTEQQFRKLINHLL